MNALDPVRIGLQHAHHRRFTLRVGGAERETGGQGNQTCDPKSPTLVHRVIGKTKIRASR